MAKNLVRNNSQPIAKEANASLAPEAQAASGNLSSGVAYEMPMKNNAARAAVQHLGAMPPKGSGKF